MTQAHGAIGFIHVLAAFTAGTEGFHVAFIEQFFVRFRQKNPRHALKRGMLLLLGKE
jgi:hypothetical protein